MRRCEKSLTISPSLARAALLITNLLLGLRLLRGAIPILALFILIWHMGSSERAIIFIPREPVQYSTVQYITFH